MSKPKNKTEELYIYILGIRKGFNKARLSVWGISYDSDKTALMIRKNLMNEKFVLTWGRC